MASFLCSSKLARSYVCQSRLFCRNQISLFSTTSSSHAEMNPISKAITQPKSQGNSQAMLLATGITKQDLNKGQVGIASVWYEGNPCNMHLLDLAKVVKESVQHQDLVGYRFNTIGVSDGISMGTSGMSYSLQSRDIIADSIETVMEAQWYDGLIGIPGCDKNMPGCVMAMSRVNRPAIMLYGGTIRAGCGAKKEPLDIVSAFQAYGKYVAGDMTEEERVDIIDNSCPGAGACGGMYTANTMATAIETLGMSLPYSSSAPAESEEKIAECKHIGEAIRNLIQNQITPKDIMTKESFENAIVITMALGGSTNAVLHLIAMAKAMDVELGLDDFHRLSDSTPFIADLKPSGKYVMEDLHNVGGTPAVIKYLLECNLLHGDCLTVTGKTLAENVEHLPGFVEGQDVIRKIENPLKATGHIRILYGNLAKEGCVSKITGKEGTVFEGKALVYDSEEDMLASFERGDIKKGVKQVCVIRYEGPKGGPGMPEMLTPTSVIMGAGLGEDVAMITDGRFSGGSHGFIIGHVTPEAQEGGEIALVENGDTIRIDADSCIMDLLVSEQELEKRRQNFTSPPLKARKGTLYKYIKTVASASQGCVTDE